MRKQFFGRPKVHPVTYPRTRLPMLLDIVRRVPPGFGGPAFRRSASAVLCGESLVRAAMEQHRARHLGNDGAQVGAVYFDDRVIVVPDKYPKSAFHFLIVPREYERLSCLNDLLRTDLGLVQHMIAVGKSVQSAIQLSKCDDTEIKEDPLHYEIFTPAAPSQLEQTRAAKDAEELNKNSVFDRSRKLHLEAPTGLLTLPNTKVKFLQGFHAIPSLPPLHMHVISLDLLGKCLKHKKHYNSFTTKFFLSAEAVEADLNQFGSIGINQEIHVLEFEERRPLECVWCGLACENLPKLRRHLPVCHKNAALL
jgi:diadenosine tetraphosphate (Ap4A) HIT family hydrolase